MLLSYRYVWESEGWGTFTVSHDLCNEPLGRGTEIRLHLRGNAMEYLEEAKIKVLFIRVCFLFLRLIVTFATSLYV